MQKVTEEPSLYRHLEQMPVEQVLESINQEDAKVHLAVRTVIPELTKLVEAIIGRMKQGGRLFYIGAGTSGRLGILDASECPPTYGVPADWVIGVIAGGDHAIRNPVEFAEDSETQAWKDLQEYYINDQDTVVGIAASGTTPYVVHGLKKCQEEGILTGSITCNPGAPVSEFADHPLEVVVGPEFVTGSTRMKAGTAQKLVLNMISTAVMIGLGRVVDNKMVDMQLSNQKLVDRGTKIIKNTLGGSYEEAKALLLQHGSVRKAIDAIRE
ncbi:MAG: N-acetylmuramic acid 6-phosphate etherase [Mameliella sp.]|nr:N-acetylmuramic acid 6-phosphate etherase [Phaeodactylibacter sp.]NRA47765.1 N-acetylmuramic acid 6-phosphate etherase [Phaeodactylibacter sp.]